jgi:hypothetical protein
MGKRRARKVQRFVRELEPVLDMLDAFEPVPKCPDCGVACVPQMGAPMTAAVCPRCGREASAPRGMWL